MSEIGYILFIKSQLYFFPLKLHIYMFAICHLVCKPGSISSNALQNLYILVMGDLDTNSGAGSLESLNYKCPCLPILGLTEGNKFSSPLERAICMRSSKEIIPGSIAGKDLSFYIFPSKFHCPKRRKITGREGGGGGGGGILSPKSVVASVS